MTTEIKMVDGKQCLVVVCPLNKQVSKSGKSLLVASSNGIKQTTAQVDGKNVSVGLNAFIKIED